MALIKQITNIVNDAVKDALGTNATITDIDTTDFTSLGKQISAYDAYEGFYKSLVNRITKTVYAVRSYEGRTRSVLRDEHEYGAFVQKVYYTLPDAVDNPAYAIPQEQTGGALQYGQASPYDVEGTVAVTSLIFGGKGTWSIEIVRPIEQIKTAFVSPAEMGAFIDGIYITVDNAYKVEEERLIAMAVNTAMAQDIAVATANNVTTARNLLSEYNTLAGTTLTVNNALTNADFLKYASKEINRTVDNMTVMSTRFNCDGYNTFTSKDNLVVEMLSEFASATDMYLQADTFHDELVKLPNYEKIPFWQGSGSSFKFEDCSKINVTHADMEGGTLEQGGIICFVHDIEHVACYFGNRRTWEIFNPRSDVMVHGEKAEKGYAVDTHANGVVFYLA